MRELIGSKGTISLLKAAVPKKGPKKRPLTLTLRPCEMHNSTKQSIHQQKTAVGANFGQIVFTDLAWKLIWNKRSY
jgi:hypothetical protein